MAKVWAVTEEEQRIEDIAERVAERVIGKLFLVFGVNTTNPDELIKVQKDFHYVRGWRESAEIIKKRGLMTAASFLVTGLFGYILFLLTKH